MRISWQQFSGQSHSFIPALLWNNFANMCTFSRYICKEDYSDPMYETLYSQMLMLLQYIVPLGVLLFTYTSIGVVIWCHRIPGEAENSRDQRIARSKKKVSLIFECSIKLVMVEQIYLIILLLILFRFRNITIRYFFVV